MHRSGVGALPVAVNAICSHSSTPAQRKNISGAHNTVVLAGQVNGYMYWPAAVKLRGLGRCTVYR
eukprot:SAG22_NODE_1183_length_5231_cov_6.467069_5_plen_65_part_00